MSVDPFGELVTDVDTATEVVEQYGAIAALISLVRPAIVSGAAGAVAGDRARPRRAPFVLSTAGYRISPFVSGGGGRCFVAGRVSREIS